MLSCLQPEKAAVVRFGVRLQTHDVGHGVGDHQRTGGNARADDIAPRRGIAAVSGNGEACEGFAAAAKRDGDHQALIALISTFV